ncbi:hypothetical protein PpBr36_03880 [Pyricularia pennisetigena]|uniref:hypothetical protein n=1 Tax=Pyricularia pennisetigena TaxID=1578925 RepID=UPI0011535A6C|nr:hypothetical protein PpBr36_03880 [Pyricularia pennisetigena]TLS29975.1 hypothetical protein PpBr36_03880 [Pyricularia pennisetigena]
MLHNLGKSQCDSSKEIYRTMLADIEKKLESLKNIEPDNKELVTLTERLETIKGGTAQIGSCTDLDCLDEASKVELHNAKVRKTGKEIRCPSQKSSASDMRATEAQINKPPRPALPTSLENVNNAPLFTSPRRSIDDRLRKHENQPKRTGMGALTESPAGSRIQSPHESIRSSSQHGPRFRAHNQSPNCSSSQAPLQSQTNLTPKSQIPRSSAAAKPRDPSSTSPKVTGPLMSQSRAPRNNVATAQSSEQGNSRLPRLSLHSPQLSHPASLEHSDVRTNDHTSDTIQSNSTAVPARQIQPSDAAKNIIVRAIGVAESDVARYKGLGRTSNAVVEQLLINSQSHISQKIAEEFGNKLQGAFSVHEDRIMKRLLSHHTGMRNHQSRVGNEIKSLITSQATKMTAEVHELGRSVLSHRLTQQSKLIPPNSGVTGSSGRKRPRTSSPPIMEENINN